MNDTFVIFLLGAIFGYAVSILHMLYLGFRAMNKTLEKTTSVSERMKRVKEITNEQLELSRQVDGPQKNGLDGKFKNNKISQMKALDEEKNNILRSIILDGNDPEITTVDTSGVVSKMKLSEYMAYMGITMEPKKDKSPGVTAEKVGRFTVVKGGKDDGGETTH